MRKLDPTDIVRDHYRTFYDNAGGSRSLSDWATAWLVPVSIASGVLLTGFRLKELGSLLAAVAVVGGFLFALMIVLLEAAVELSGRAEMTGASARSRRRIVVIREVHANVAYSVLVSLVTVIALAVGQMAMPDGNRGLRPAWSALIVLALVHLVVTLLMVLKRAYGVTYRELDYAAVPDETPAR